MRSHKQALDRAARHLRAGEFAQAEAVCRQIVEKAPRHAEAWALLGVSACQGGKGGPALEYLERAVALAPNVASFRSDHAVVLQTLGRLTEAEAEYCEAVRLSPNFTAAHVNLGNVLGDLGRLDEAAVCYRRALQLNPAFPEAHNNLGNVLRSLGKLEEAVASYQRALGLRSVYPEALNNLGAALRDLGRLAEAEPYFVQALQLKPGFPEVLNNLGTLYADQGRAEEALPLLQRVLEVNPGIAQVHYNLGNSLQALGRIPEAAAAYQRALQLKPNDVEARTNLAQVLLLTGDFERGFAEYEWRWKLKAFALPALAQPRWDGSPLEGRTILLLPEQGLGDTIHFVRYAALVKARGARVLLYCPRPLLGILRNCPGIDELVPEGTEPPPFDVHAPLLSLPRLFGTTLDTIPAPVPYLAADPRLAEQWRTRLAEVPGFKVGIAWQGSVVYRADRQRSVPLSMFEPPARVPGVRLISLQKGPGAQQVAEVAERFTVLDWGPELDEAAGPFMDTAALLTSLDLVITVDTAIVHLAGALGVPTWLAQCFMPHWPWMLEREDSPWYPTVRLFRQRRRGDWDEVFARMTSALAARISEPEA